MVKKKVMQEVNQEDKQRTNRVTSRRLRKSKGKGDKVMDRRTRSKKKEGRQENMRRCCREAKPRLR